MADVVGRRPGLAERGVGTRPGRNASRTRCSSGGGRAVPPASASVVGRAGRTRLRFPWCHGSRHCQMGWPRRRNNSAARRVGGRKRRPISWTRVRGDEHGKTGGSHRFGCGGRDPGGRFPAPRLRGHARHARPRQAGRQGGRQRSKARVGSMARPRNSAISWCSRSREPEPNRRSSSAAPKTWTVRR